MKPATEKTIIALLLASVCFVLVVGWVLSRDNDNNLSIPGIPNCTFAKITGIPCPLCGGYSAFSHGMRGEFEQAWRENPFSLLLLATLILAVPALMVALVWPGGIKRVIRSRIFIVGSIVWGVIMFLVLVVFWLGRL